MDKFDSWYLKTWVKTPKSSLYLSKKQSSDQKIYFFSGNDGYRVCSKAVQAVFAGEKVPDSNGPREFDMAHEFSRTTWAGSQMDRVAE